MWVPILLWIIPFVLPICVVIILDLFLIYAPEGRIATVITEICDHNQKGKGDERDRKVVRLPKKAKNNLEEMSTKEFPQKSFGYFCFGCHTFYFGVSFVTYTVLLLATLCFMMGYLFFGYYLFLCHLVLLVIGFFAGDKKSSKRH